MVIEYDRVLGRVATERKYIHCVALLGGATRQLIDDLLDAAARVGKVCLVKMKYSHVFCALLVASTVAQSGCLCRPLRIHGLSSAALKKVLIVDEMARISVSLRSG